MRHCLAYLISQVELAPSRCSRGEVFYRTALRRFSRFLVLLTGSPLTPNLSKAIPITLCVLWATVHYSDVKSDLSVHDGYEVATISTTLASLPREYKVEAARLHRHMLFSHWPSSHPLSREACLYGTCAEHQRFVRSVSSIYL
ncbi:hypothetical protein K474DRAFT_1114329 [Panus rudis PR-1116 ss-1]|nr:hypothetical protein K474DRAFT_1114329 [Panus rudis PR-1116 ss-1]